jgi:hypothetical protein
MAIDDDYTKEEAQDETVCQADHHRSNPDTGVPLHVLANLDGSYVREAQTSSDRNSGVSKKENYIQQLLFLGMGSFRPQTPNHETFSADMVLTNNAEWAGYRTARSEQGGGCCCYDHAPDEQEGTCTLGTDAGQDSPSEIFYPLEVWAE